MDRSRRDLWGRSGRLSPTVHRPHFHPEVATPSWLRTNSLPRGGPAPGYHPSTFAVRDRTPPRPPPPGDPFSSSSSTSSSSSLTEYFATVRVMGTTPMTSPRRPPPPPRSSSLHRKAFTKDSNNNPQDAPRCQIRSYDLPRKVFHAAISVFQNGPLSKKKTGKTWPNCEKSNTLDRPPKNSTHESDFSPVNRKWSSSLFSLQLEERSLSMRSLLGDQRRRFEAKCQSATPPRPKRRAGTSVPIPSPRLKKKSFQSASVTMVSAFFLLRFDIAQEQRTMSNDCRVHSIHCRCQVFVYCLAQFK